MKPGDLMQISDPTGVYVVNTATGHAMPGPCLFGTPAIVLGWHEPREGRGERKVRVLIEGIQGWCYESELEPIDEAR
jgi:hypothetical protein